MAGVELSDEDRRILYDWWYHGATKDEKDNELAQRLGLFDDDME